MGTTNDAARGGAVAGRELDARVAVEVMGWRHKPGTVDIYYPPEVPIEHPCTMVPYVPHYSTDIAAAWEVVEAMRARGWSLTLDAEPEWPEWTCWFVDHATEVRACVVAATAPLAICVAALAATDPTRNAPFNAGTPERDEESE